MEELDRRDSTAECVAFVTSLQEFGRIIERSDTFWAERIQYPVQWDPVQGVVTECSKVIASKDPSDNFDALTSSEETARTYFDPRKILCRQS